MTTKPNMKKLFFILLSLVFFINVSPVFASNDIEVICDGNGSCNITPDLPIFDDIAVYPGQTITSQVKVQNTSSYSGDLAFKIENLTDSLVNPMMDFIISSDKEGNDISYGPVTLDLLNNSYILLSNFSAGEEKDYYFHAIFDKSAGNDYQNLKTSFDLTLAFDFVKDEQNINISNTSFTTTSVSTTPAQAPKCDNDNLFSSGPRNFQIDAQTNNSMTLSWDAVAGASGYAIFFTRADGESYSVLPSMIPEGATSFTINNLAAANYAVEIVAIGGNDDLCSSPRSSTSVAIIGGVVSGRPQTEAGEVLGEKTNNDNQEKSNQEKVLGVSDTCQAEGESLPYILLASQFVMVLVVFVIYRKKPTYLKHFVVLAVTGLTILLFYLLKNCDCWQEGWWTTLVCQWFFILSLALSLILEPINYYLIEE